MRAAVLAIPTLLDLTITSANGMTPFAWVSRIVRPWKTTHPAPVSTESSIVVMPLSRAATALISLNVEPGSIRSVMAWLRRWVVVAAPGRLAL